MDLIVTVNKIQPAQDLLQDGADEKKTISLFHSLRPFQQTTDFGFLVVEVLVQVYIAILHIDVVINKGRTKVAVLKNSDNIRMITIAKLVYGFDLVLDDLRRVPHGRSNEFSREDLFYSQNIELYFC